MGFEMPRDQDGDPFVSSEMPNHDDEDPIGVSFFKTGLEDADLSSLSLPRTFFGRSLFARVSFENTLLSDSRMCWTDFDECDFTGADLSGCDVRASNFEGCSFDNATLAGADLRSARFIGCSFIEGDLSHAIVDRQTAAESSFEDELTDGQRSSIHWVASPGEEPPGG